MAIFGHNNYCTSTDPTWSGNTTFYMDWKLADQSVLQRKSLRNLVFGSSRVLVKSYRKGSKIWFSLLSKKWTIFLFSQRAIPEPIGYFRFKLNSWSKKNSSDFHYGVIFRKKIWLKNAQNHQTSQCLNTGHSLKSCLESFILTYIIYVIKCLRGENFNWFWQFFQMLEEKTLQKTV